MIKRTIKTAAGILLVFLAVSCSDRSEGRAEALYEASEPSLMSAAAPDPAASMAAPAGRSATKSEASADRLSGAEVQPVDATAGRKLVYQASMDMEAADLEAAESFLDAAVQAAGGYVARRNADTNSVYMQVRVPVAALESLMDSLAGQGRTLERSLTAEDVTDQYFDLEGRLRNKRLLEARYREYLGEAGTMDEILQVERSLSEVTTEIEWLEGSFRDLGKRIDLATLSVSIHTPYSTDLSRPTLGQSMRRLLGGFGEALRIFLVILAGLVLYGIPALLVMAGLWWLAFGRLGLVRRLFALAGRNRKKPGSEV
jgi:hypothetical protein